MVGFGSLTASSASSRLSMVTYVNVRQIFVAPRFFFLNLQIHSHVTCPLSDRWSPQLRRSRRTSRKTPVDSHRWCDTADLGKAMTSSTGRSDESMSYLRRRFSSMSYLSVDSLAWYRWRRLECFDLLWFDQWSQGRSRRKQRTTTMTMGIKHGWSKIMTNYLSFCIEMIRDDARRWQVVVVENQWQFQVCRYKWMSSQKCSLEAFSSTRQSMKVIQFKIDALFSIRSIQSPL